VTRLNRGKEKLKKEKKCVRLAHSHVQKQPVLNETWRKGARDTKLAQRKRIHGVHRKHRLRLTAEEGKCLLWGQFQQRKGNLKTSRRVKGG